MYALRRSGFVDTSAALSDAEGEEGCPEETADAGVGRRLAAPAERAIICDRHVHQRAGPKYWDGCPSADKGKIYQCLVVKFLCMQDYGGGIKGAGMQLKASWERAEPSLW